MFSYLKAGDRVTRLIGEQVRMTMMVREVTPALIICDALQDNGSVFEGGWTFDPITGAEIDEDLQWGPKYGVTGSRLVK